MKKYIVSAVVIVVIGIILAVVFASPAKNVNTLAVGDTQSTPKMIQAVCNNAATTTYTSFYNSDANDRIASNVDIYVEASSTSPLASMTAGTSTNSVTVPVANFFNNNTATSTLPVYVSTSSPANTGVTPANRIWPSGTYLNFVANATTSGYCAIKVNYIAK